LLETNKKLKQVQFSLLCQRPDKFYHLIKKQTFYTLAQRKSGGGKKIAAHSWVDVNDASITGNMCCNRAHFISWHHGFNKKRTAARQGNKLWWHESKLFTLAKQ
jgi:hypothetical protein